MKKILQYSIFILLAGCVSFIGCKKEDPSPVTACDPGNRQEINVKLVPFGSLSEPRMGISAAFAGNKILFAGGFDPDAFVMGSSRVDIYDITTRLWSTAELSVGGSEVVTYGNKIFFAGGTATIGIYDAVTGIWSTTQLSEERSELAATSAGNKLFFGGGIKVNPSPSIVSNKVDVYDVIADKWSTTNLSLGRSALSAVSAANKIYFAGGNTTTSYCSSTNFVDIYDNVTNTWSNTKMNKWLAWRTSIAVRNKIFWAGGESYDCNGKHSLSSDVEILDLNTKTTSYSCLFQPNAKFKAVVKDDKIIFFIGEGYRTKFDIYNITTDTWSIGVLPTSIYAAAIISVDNTVYVAGGYMNGALSNHVWKLDF